MPVSTGPASPATLRATVDVEPFPFYERLRETGPVVWDESMNAWLVISRAACRDVQRSEEVLYRHA